MSSREKKLSIRLSATGGEKLRLEFQRLGKDGKRAFDGITNATKPASAGLKAVDTTARALNSVFRQAAGLVGAYAGLQGITRGLGFIISSNREFERLNASLKTVTGSAENARAAFAMIEDFASETPYNVEQITTGFIRLKSLGLDPSAEALRSYGNTASAMGKSLIQFVEAIADATTGEFERLKEFGIKSSSEGKKVTFTFQGISTTVGKNAAEIEQYLRNIGNVQFAGAMTEQMDTMNGVFSNIQDNLSRLSREVGAGGLNDAIKDVSNSLREASSTGDSAARSLGKNLGSVVTNAADTLGFLADNADIAATALTGLLIARTVSGAITSMNAAVIGNAGAIVGIRMMAQVSAGAAVKLTLLESAAKLAAVATGTLHKAMMLLGGPAGVVAISIFALYNLTKGHDAASKAAKDHAAELNELTKKAQQSAQTIEKLNQVSREEAIARWTEKLKIANDNIHDVTEQLKYGQVGGFWDQFKRGFSSTLTRDLRDVRKAFQEGRLSAEEYNKYIWKIAVKHPEFTEQAKDINRQVLALKAAETAAKNASEELGRLKSGKPSKAKTNPTDKTTTDKPASSSDEVEVQLENIKTVYQTVAEVRARDVENSRQWQDGVARSMADYVDNATNAAKQAEKALTGAFSSMEDAIVNFAMTGKMSFADFANSIISDMVRIMVQQSITGPIANALGNYFSQDAGASTSGTPIPGQNPFKTGIAHTGGIIGSDSLATRSVSPAVFDGAPKFHTGGIVGGLTRDEVPIIARRGEGVFTPAQMAAMGNSDVNVTIINETGTNAQAEVSRQQDSKGIERLIVRLFCNDARKNGPMTRSMAGTFGLSRQGG